MPDVTMLNEIQSILQGQTPIPQKITNRLVLSALVEFNTSLIKTAELYEKLENRVGIIENYQKDIAQQRIDDQKTVTEVDKKNMTWP